MPSRRAKTIREEPTPGSPWHRDTPRQGRFAALSLSAAGLAVVLIWGVWRHACAAAEPAIPPAGPPVQIGVVADSTHVRIIAYGGFDILSSAGGAVFTCAGPNVLRFSASAGPPDASFYYVGAAGFEKRQKPYAHRMLGQLRDALKVGMEILLTSDKLAFPRGRPGQGDRLLVCVGPFNDIKLAEQWQQYLARTYPAYIIRDASKRAMSEIHLYDHTNRLLARMKDSVTIRLKDDKQTLTAEPLESSATAWPTQRRTGNRYHGTLEIHLNDQGRLTAINALSLEEYINGVVPSEIGGSAPEASLKAQAIAARSEAFHKLFSEHHGNDLFDFCDKTHCQAYHGVEDQAAASLGAVAATRGLVLTYADQVVDAVYCHSCGGVSADSTDVWRSTNYPFYQAACDRRFGRSSPNLASERQAESWISSRPDVFCNSDQRGFPDYARKYFRWVRTLDGASLQRLINNHQNVGQILDVQIAERAESGRVRVLRVVGSKGSFKFTGIENVCTILNDPPSSFFVLDVEHEKANPYAVKSLTIRGGGFGHGVGLCQMGAYMMGTRGYAFEEILAHYYPKTSLRKAY